MVQTKVFQRFTSSFKERQFKELERKLAENKIECLLIGNYRIMKTDYDAIIITSSDIFVVEFKESLKEGTITVNDTGWTYSDGNMVWAGNHAITPFEQLRHKRNCLFGCLRRAAIGNKLFIKTMVVFSMPFSLEKGETLLNDVYDDTHGWFLTSTSDTMIYTLQKHTSIFDLKYKNQFESFASYFGISQPIGKKRMLQKICALCLLSPKILRKIFGIKRFSHSNRNALFCIERIKLLILKKEVV